MEVISVTTRNIQQPVYHTISYLLHFQTVEGYFTQYIKDTDYQIKIIFI